MDLEIGEGSVINRIFMVLDQIFPEYMELEKLKTELNRTGGVIKEPELKKYLVYLEDKNWIRKQGNKFRMTAQGMDVKVKAAKSEGGFEVWEL